MIRFNRINMLKFFLVTATVLIGFNFILKSGERARNDDLFLPNLGDVDLNRLPIDLYEGKQTEESIDGHPKLKLKLVENVKEKIEENIKKPEIVVDENSNNNIVDNEHKLSSSSSKYILDISKERINKLFDILHDKEKLFSGVFKSLGLIVFDNLISGNDEPALKDFSREKERFLKVVDNRVTVTDEFVSYLHNLSDYYSFEHPRNTVKRSKLSEDQNRPVFVTAANSNYYMPLQATIYQLHRNLPGYDIIVYDLGLTEEQYNMTVSNCKCKVVKFDQYYGKVSEHVKDLKTYAWKPLLIQETLKTHPSVFYMDSSIRISTDEIGSQLSTLRETGLLTQFIALKLNCYTNPLMFKWFDEKEKSFSDFYTIEANILLFERTFLSSLLMKAWVTCALERDCIAPPGSNIGGCCGCHRFDQDAITIVSSFFYGHPKDANSKLPAYSFTAPESYFFSVRRYEGKAYFTQKP